VVKPARKLGSIRVTPVGMGLAPPIDERLDQLLWLATKAGRTTSRQRLVGALILDSPTTGDGVAAMLDRYQDTTEDEILIPGVRLGDRDSKKPGRRTFQK
jgi:hypothetical protein